MPTNEGERMWGLFNSEFGTVTYSDGIPLFNARHATATARAMGKIYRNSVTDRNGVRISGDPEIVDYLLRHTPPTRFDIPDMFGTASQVLKYSLDHDGRIYWSTGTG